MSTIECSRLLKLKLTRLKSWQPSEPESRNYSKWKMRKNGKRKKRRNRGSRRRASWQRWYLLPSQAVTQLTLLLKSREAMHFTRLDWHQEKRKVKVQKMKSTSQCIGLRWLRDLFLSKRAVPLLLNTIQAGQEETMATLRLTQKMDRSQCQLSCGIHPLCLPIDWSIWEKLFCTTIGWFRSRMTERTAWCR